MRNIYVVCGDGCEKQLLHSGTLVENKVYECTVEYKAEEEKKAVDNSDAILAQMAAMQKRMEEMEKRNEQIEKQNEQMQQALRNQQKSDNKKTIQQAESKNQENYSNKDKGNQSETSSSNYFAKIKKKEAKKKANWYRRLVRTIDIIDYKRVGL